MRQLLIILTLLFSQQLIGQSLNKYWVQFADKKENPYSVLQPQQFLSPRAIERRQRLGIAVEELDLPVTPKYLDALKQNGAKIYTTSRWFNAATVYIENEADLEKIKKLPFVKTVEGTGSYRKPRIERRRKNRDYRSTYYQIDNPYGFGWNQISMMNGHLLHDLGFRGEGMLIAVLDGGFVNLDISPFFDSVRINYNLLESRDFVDNDRWAYEASNHGFQVASTIISNLPGLFVGTAPDAALVCIRTEEVGSELRIEEDNWIAGAEYADSLGADVINSSLGYTNFDRTFMSYTYKDMDGNTARISRGADIAASRGILVVNSAGNEGDGTWRYIGAPADADSVLTVGAVTENGRKAGFSSFGPTRDGRLKPEVSARGYQTVVATPTYQVDSSNGTSFSSPVMAGMVTALWQAFPNKTNMEIKAAVEQSGNLAARPNNELGNGIPDMLKAFYLLSGSPLRAENLPAVIYNPTENRVNILLPKSLNTAATVEISNILGQTLMQKEVAAENRTMRNVAFENLTQLTAGVYFVTVSVGSNAYKFKFLK
jgi:serine protease AprX